MRNRKVRCKLTRSRPRAGLEPVWKGGAHSCHATHPDPSILSHFSWATKPELSFLSYLSWDISHELSFLSHLSWSIFPELSILSSWAIFPCYPSLLSFLRYLFYSCNSPESLHDGFLHPNPIKPCASVELLFQCVHIAAKVEPFQQVMIRYHRSICILRVSHFNWNIFRSPKEGQYQQR